MSEYLEVIKAAIMFFPILAFLITIPYILYQYHKYGSIYYLRVVIVYSFILYLLVSYFLVILPLPTIQEVAQLTTPRVQLIPFQFVVDFIRESSLDITNIQTYGKALLEPCGYVIFYNLLLCLPFGIYLHYYFQKNLKQTIILTFSLSLFFELTQLTGLYFIYPRGYRLFDVDDLILNTMGGILGYYVGYLFLKVLPNRDTIDEKAYLLGQRVSVLRREVAFGGDIFLFFLLEIVISFFTTHHYFFWVVGIIYYIIIPILLKGRTFSFWFLNLKIASQKEELHKYQIILRQVFWIIEIFVLPYGLLKFFFLFMSWWKKSFSFFFFLLLLLFYIAYYLMIGVSILFKKPLFYERISQTLLISTISKK